MSFEVCGPAVYVSKYDGVEITIDTTPVYRYTDPLTIFVYSEDMSLIGTTHTILVEAQLQNYPQIVGSYEFTLVILNPCVSP